MQNKGSFSSSSLLFLSVGQAQEQIFGKWGRDRLLEDVEIVKAWAANGSLLSKYVESSSQELLSIWHKMDFGSVLYMTCFYKGILNTYSTLYLVT